MQQDRFFEPQNTPIFHPTPEGCVAHDLRFARAMEEIYIDELTAIAASSYRAMLAEPYDRDLSELLRRQMLDEIAHFRFAGELILSLGGNPCIRTQIRVEPIARAVDRDTECARLPRTVLRMALSDKKRSIDRYQTLLGRTQDRVVRSLLSQLTDEEQRHAESLKRYAERYE